MPRLGTRTPADKVKRRTGDARAALPENRPAQKAEVDPFGGGTSTSAAPVTGEVAVVSGPGAGTSIGGTAGEPLRPRRAVDLRVVLRAVRFAVLRAPVARLAVDLRAVFFAADLRAVFLAVDLRAVVFLAVRFRAVFFAADLRAVVFRAVLLRAVDFLAVDLRAVFFAADLRAVFLAVFFAVDLRAVVFRAVLLRAVDFLAAVFLAPVDFRAVVRLVDLRAVFFAAAGATCAP